MFMHTFDMLCMARNEQHVHCKNGLGKKTVEENEGRKETHHAIQQIGFSICRRLSFFRSLSFTLYLCSMCLSVCLFPNRKREYALIALDCHTIYRLRLNAI